MKIIKSLAAAAVAMAVFSCANAQSASYTVTVPLSEDEEGLVAYLVDYDTSSKIDSTEVVDAQAVFTGTINKPAMVQLIVDGGRYGTFILESGNILGKNRQYSGTALNEKMNDFFKKSNELGTRFQASKDDAARAAINDEYEELIQQMIDENINNPIGLYIMLQKAYDMDLATLEATIAKYPALAESKRLSKLRNNLVKKEETSVGKMFKDFEITQPDGTKKKLSDYVGKGQYALVDFWASWCGPCMRQAVVLKEIYNKYASKGLVVLGVAVWDEVQNTQKAIKEHDLPWHHIIDAKTIPTDLYGISGIPCIILFDPSGKIVSRDKQGDELKADVDAAMKTLEEAAATTEE